MFFRKKDLWKDVSPLFGFLVTDFGFHITKADTDANGRGEYVAVRGGTLQVNFEREYGGPVSVYISSVGDKYIVFDLEVIMHYLQHAPSWEPQHSLANDAAFLKESMADIEDMYSDKNIENTRQRLHALVLERIRVSG